jgi:hypothetical protein
MADIQTKLPVRSGILDDSAFGVATEEVFPFAAYADETAPDSVDEGDIGMLRMTLTRLLKVKLVGDDGGDDVNVAVDSDGNFAISGTYAEDSAHTSGDTGSFVLAVRNDTLGSLVSTNGDYAPLQVNASGALYVNVSNTVTVTGTVSVSGTVDVDTSFDYAEDSAHTSGDVGAFVLAVRNDAGTSLVSTDGDYAPLQVDATGALRISGDLTSNSEYAEDSVHTSGEVGAFILAVRADNQGTLSSASGDYDALQTQGDGLLRVKNSYPLSTARSIIRYGTVASVANNSTGTISYDRDGLTTTFLLKQVIATSSGAPCKVVITHTAGAATVAVGFYSTASPLINYTFSQPIPVTSTAATAVSVAITNNAGPAQDVYATILGEEA